MKINFMTTRQAAERLGIKIGWLSMIVYRRMVQEPQRGPSGQFLWTEKDIARVRKTLNKQTIVRTTKSERQRDQKQIA